MPNGLKIFILSALKKKWRTSILQTFKYSNRNLEFILVILLIGYISISNMRAVYLNELPFKDQLMIGLTFIGILSLCIFLLTRMNKVNRMLALMLLFVVFSFIPTINLYMEYSFSYIVNILGQTYFWIASFSLAYICNYYSHKGNMLVKATIILLPIFCFMFFNIKEFSQIQDTALISMVYYCVFLMPFVFMMEKKLLKFTAILLILVCVLLSVKRTAFLAFSGTILVYYFVNYKIHAKNSRLVITSILSGAIGTIFIYAFSNYIVEFFDVNIIYRIQTMLDDQGSGRIEIWNRTWEMIKQSSVPGLIFGHGFNAVYIDSFPQYSAHNDFLEILYDYGLIGIYIYLRIYYNLIKYAIKLYNAKSKYAAPFISSITLALIMSLTSHLIIYPTYFILLCIFWGTIISYCDKYLLTGSGGTRI
ncbi:O-antigen ligase domain-containing protein [Bacillus cereus]|uniref:O-antigen ligase domain-containing protein n=1 Tax=Bacillus cereus TaxID=1396 RepID=A0A9W7Q4Q9_BACCE|nr:O-antigen ligase family protein [Bacillus cereus]KAA6467042.1 O-antigen ligase domain-containing protein [Bacillus cereus]KAB2505670.1 O-antigen ligase family protein [Bacillus cereus]